jgi:hypothetical protein
MPTLLQMKSALDALAFRLQSLSSKERERLGRREIAEIDALVKLGREEIQLVPNGRGQPDELARLEGFVARVSAQFEGLLREPSGATRSRPVQVARAGYRADPDDSRHADEGPRATGQG